MSGQGQHQNQFQQAPIVRGAAHQSAGQGGLSLPAVPVYGKNPVVQKKGTPRGGDDDDANQDKSDDIKNMWLGMARSSWREEINKNNIGFTPDNSIIKEPDTDSGGNCHGYTITRVTGLVFLEEQFFRLMDPNGSYILFFSEGRLGHSSLYNGSKFIHYLINIGVLETDDDGSTYNYEHRVTISAGEIDWNKSTKHTDTLLLVQTALNKRNGKDDTNAASTGVETANQTSLDGRNGKDNANAASASEQTTTSAVNKASPGQQKHTVNWRQSQAVLQELKQLYDDLNKKLKKTTSLQKTLYADLTKKTGAVRSMQLQIENAGFNVTSDLIQQAQTVLMENKI